jgi:peptide/nickel transport system permease protein
MSLKARWEEFRTGMRPRIAEWRFMLKRVRESSLALAGVVIILFFVAMAILAPVLAPPQGSDPFKIPQDTEIELLTSQRPTPPTLRHIFGTMDSQYDMYYGCIWGTITAFRIGVLVVAISLVAGLLVGTISAYYGGVLDEALMRFTDIIIAFPGLILAMALVLAFPGAIAINMSAVLLVTSVVFMLIFLAFKPDRRWLSVFMFVLIFSVVSILYYPIIIDLALTNLDKVLIAISLVGWPTYARVIRGEVLRVKNEDYVEASKASGSSDFSIITRHILPNSIYPVLILSTLDIGSIVLTAAALSFIGIGAPADYADWGQIISRAQPWIGDAPSIIRNFHTFFIPGLFIALFVVGWNLLGDALRDVLDPMLRRR